MCAQAWLTTQSLVRILTRAGATRQVRYGGVDSKVSKVPGPFSISACPKLAVPDGAGARKRARAPRVPHADMAKSVSLEVSCTGRPGNATSRYPSRRAMAVGTTFPSESAHKFATIPAPGRQFFQMRVRLPASTYSGISCTARPRRATTRRVAKRHSHKATLRFTRARRPNFASPWLPNFGRDIPNEFQGMAGASERLGARCRQAQSWPKSSQTPAKQ